RTKMGAGDVDCETEVGRLGAGGPSRPKMSLADMNRAVPRLAQQPRQRDVIPPEPTPIPLRRSIGSTIVTIGIDPVRGAMPRRILTGHQRDTSRRTDTHRAKIVEPDATSSQPLHVGRAVEIVQRKTLRRS